MTLLLAISVPVNHLLITSELERVHEILSRSPETTELMASAKELEGRLWLFATLDVLTMVAFGILWAASDRHPISTSLGAWLLYAGLWISCWQLGAHGSLLIRLFFFVPLSYSVYRALGLAK